MITSLGQVTPQWLSGVLSTSGALTRGAVTTCEVVSRRGNYSANANLRVRYSVGSRGALPPRLFLKMVNADQGDEFFGPSEVAYYTRDYVDVESAPLLRCYDAAYSEERRCYHLLLEDVSATYLKAAEKKPTLGYGLALAEGLAALHARWWGAQHLAEAKAPIHNAEHIQRFVDIAQPGAGHILEHFSAQLAPHWPDDLGALFAGHPPALIARAGDANGFTLIHGDAGHNNILVPREADRPIYLIDRQPFDWSLTTWLGAYDLAYAMVLDWEVKTRRRLERRVLRHYHAWLNKYGVEGYSWGRLYDDYRLCAAMGVYVATEYCRGGINKRRTPVWLSMLKRALTACDDLQCDQLW